MADVNVISNDNGVGLSRDVEIIANLLRKQGIDVSFQSIKSPPKVSRLNIFVEMINPAWIGSSKKNCLVPNPEWCFTNWVSHIRKMDLILCKTKFTQQIFNQFAPTYYTSFTSNDLLDLSVTKDDFKLFHLAGKSPLKGTMRLVKLWEQNPSLPELTIVQNRTIHRRHNPIKNIKWIVDYISGSSLSKFMNESGIHLCPSEAEGWGHYIAEGLSVGSLVITTNAPPMNEVVTEDRGLLCKYVSKRPIQLGFGYMFEQNDFKQHVLRALSMEESERRKKKENARKFFLENDAFFRNEFVKAIQSLL